MERYIPIIIFISGILFGIFLTYFLFKKEKLTLKKVFKNILIEILIGGLFLIYAFSLDFNKINININYITYLVFGLIYISTLLVIAVTDKQKNIINKTALFVGIIASMIYSIYISITVGFAYIYVIYLFILLLLLLIDTLLLKEKLKSNYLISILILCIYILIFTSAYVFILTCMLTVTAIAIVFAIKGIANIIRKKKRKDILLKNTPILLFLSISNIVVMIYTNFLYHIM